MDFLIWILRVVRGLPSGVLKRRCGGLLLVDAPLLFLVDGHAHDLLRPLLRERVLGRLAVDLVALAVEVYRTWGICTNNNTRRAGKLYKPRSPLYRSQKILDVCQILQENMRCFGKLSPRSTQCTPLHRSQCSIFFKIAENVANFFAKFC